MTYFIFATTQKKSYSIRIGFKILLLVYRSLNDLVPEYVNGWPIEYKPSNAMRSTHSGQFVEPLFQSKHGEVIFSW